MKQNSALFFMATILAVFSLVGVKYAEPFFNGDLRTYGIKWNDFISRMSIDTGLELSFPMYSLIAFIGCALTFAVVKRFRGFIFLLALVNMLFVIAIPTLVKIFIAVPFYDFDNGYYLHLISSLLLLILAISSLNKRDKESKSRRVIDDMDLLDTLN